MMDSSTAPYKYYVMAAKLALVLIMGYFIYKRLFVANELPLLWSQWDLGSVHWTSLYLCIMLLIVNLSLEATKWKQLMALSEPRSFGQSLYAIICGICLGIISPARIGEYAGRTISLGSSQRKESLFATFVCSQAQLVASLAIGIIALVCINTERLLFSMPSPVVYSLLGLALLIIIAIYFNISKIVNYLARSTSLGAYLDEFIAYKLSHRQLLMTLFLSIGRYLVYATQYVLILYFFGVQDSYVSLVAHVAVIFLLQTIVPLPAILSLLARGSIAVLILSFLDINELVILSSTLVIWMLNLMLPALVGLLLIVRTKKL